jgi:hypothetical protein
MSTQIISPKRYKGQSGKHNAGTDGKQVDAEDGCPLTRIAAAAEDVSEPPATKREVGEVDDDEGEVEATLPRKGRGELKSACCSRGCCGYIQHETHPFQRLAE